MATVASPFSWFRAFKTQERSTAVDRGAPDGSRRSPVFIYDAITPCHDETLLLQVLRADALRNDS
ncbi:MAG: hypothetical protein AAGA05_13900 [Pseudomonadota bacterium]